MSRGARPAGSSHRDFVQRLEIVGAIATTLAASGKRQELSSELPVRLYAEKLKSGLFDELYAQLKTRRPSAGIAAIWCYEPDSCLPAFVHGADAFLYRMGISVVFSKAFPL